MSETPWELNRDAPAKGQHNEKILMNELGVSVEELARLKENGVV